MLQTLYITTGVRIAVLVFTLLSYILLRVLSAEYFRRIRKVSETKGKRSVKK